MTTAPVTIDCPECGSGYARGRLQEHMLTAHPNPAAAAEERRAMSDAPLKPHPFARKDVTGRPAENARFCARLDCDGLWDNPIHDPLAFTPDIGEAIKHHGVTTEFLNCALVSQVHPRHLWQPGENTEFFTCTGRSNKEECEHPNGFGAYGCPCGASGPPEDDDAPEVIDPGPAKLKKVAEVQDSAAHETDTTRPRAKAAPVPPEVMAGLREANLDLFYDPDVSNDELMRASTERKLTNWWLQRAEQEAQAVVPKAISYGSNSLMQLGRKMAQLQGREVEDDEALELGCWVNAVQKIERWTDAVMRGERCSDDSIYDLGIYVKMAQRIRDTGSWPGV